jgi:hypothetical protein
MQDLTNAVISKDLLQNIIDNRQYNETIIKYYAMYVQELEGDLKLLKDLEYLFVNLQFALNDKTDAGKPFAFKTSIIGLSTRVEFDLEGKDLYNYEDVKYLKKKLKSAIDSLECGLINVLTNKIDNLDNCNKFWDIDKFIEHKQKWVVKQNLCKDRFCSNCKKVKQASRMSKYIPVLEQYQDSLFHLVLTLPNCKGEELFITYDKMAKTFKRLINFLNGNKKIKGIDFSSWGYQGAVRSLEVTFKKDSYHPHFHVGIVLDPNVVGKKDIQNIYSFNYKGEAPELKRMFSEQEILIQKIWYLLINDIKVTKKSIEDLEQGYSCTLDKFPEEDFAELFKYMTKDKDEVGNILTYDNFKALYQGLYRVKQIQGYGVLYRITDSIDLEKYEEAFQAYIEELTKKESPVAVREKPQELILDAQYKILNKKSYIKYLRQL